MGMSLGVFKVLLRQCGTERDGSVEGGWLQDTGYQVDHIRHPK